MAAPYQKRLKGKTDWAKLAAMRDHDIKFTKDGPRTSRADWANAVVHRGLPLPSGEIWMLLVYAKSLRDNIPGHLLKEVRKEIENG